MGKREQCLQSIAEAISWTIGGSEDQANWGIAIKIAKKIPIVSCKRIGKYRKHSPRPISAQFLHMQDKEHLLMKRKELEQGIYVDLQNPQEIQAKRTILHPILKYASEAKEYQRKCKLVEYVLIFNGKLYTVDTIGQLPEKVSTIKSTQKTNGTMLAYFWRLNPFSNSFPCTFEVSGQTYNSSEQWIQYKKAIFFSDRKIANEIMNSTSPQ